MPDFTDDYVQDVRAAEAAAQRSVCYVPAGDLPDELEQALARRVEVNLTQADGRTVVRVGSTDPEVRRLEAPFNRRRVAPGDSTTDGGHPRRSTKKKTTRKGRV